MATVQLSRIEQILRHIQADAQVTRGIFQDLARTLETMQTAKLAQTASSMQRAADQARRFNENLTRAAQAQQRVNQAARAARAAGPAVISGALSTKEAVPPAVDKGLIARQTELNRVFGTGAAAQKRAAEFARQYGFALKDLSRVTIDPITKTRQFSFETGKATGVLKRATFAFDRFGNQVGDSSTRFRNFTDMISRNILKVLEWAVAVGVIYGSIAKLRDVFQTLVELDEVMSDITITTQQAGEALNVYFESATRVARTTGIALRDVLSVYDDALRATASIADEQERTAVATQLLTDAMLLSRLTGTEVNVAMDSMIGALKQIAATQRDAEGATASTSETFKRGEEVLGTWILATRSSKLSLKDLADTFAITGAAASAAGLDIAELSALTAVLAENTVKSASEIGNSIRRMITTVQSDSGIGALRRVGIAVEDLSGEMRDWDEIMTDIASRRRAGAITDAAFRQLTYSLGGGPRGAADIAAVIETWDQVIAKSKQFGNTAAAAQARQDALAAKSNTLKNAINDLNTAFASLVNTMGAEGGLLNTARVVLEVFTGLVGIVGEFSDVIGPATTRALALGTAFIALQRYGPHLATKYGGATVGPGGALTGGVMGAFPGYGARAEAPQQPGFRGMAQQAGRQFGTPQFALAAVYALSQIGTEGTAQEKGVRVGATIAGAIIGTLTPAGPLIGAAIGDAAGNAFLNAIETKRLRTQDVVDFKPDELAIAFESSYKDLMTRLSPAGLLADVFEPVKAQERTAELLEAYRERGRPAVEERVAERPLGKLGFEYEVDELDQVLLRLMEIEEQQRLIGQLTQDQVDGAEFLANARIKDVAAIQRQIVEMDVAAEIQRDIFEALTQMEAGTITKKEFKDIKQAGDDFLATGADAFEVYKQIESIDLAPFAEAFIKLGPEARGEFQELVVLANQLEDAIAIGDEVDVNNAKLKQTEEELRIIFNMAKAGEEAFKFEGFVDVDASAAEFEQLLARAVELQASYAEQLGLDPEDVVGSADEWIAHFEEIFRGVEGVHQNFFKLAETEWKEMQKNIDAAFNLQRMKDVSPAQIPELERRVKYWETFLSKVPGYADQAETQPFNLVLGEDNTFHRLVTTQEALRFAIEDLTAVEEKQLEGQWNIPEGATVMVPLQSLFYSSKGGGAGGVPSLPGATFGDGEMFAQPASKMDMAGDKMLEAATTLGDYQDYALRHPEDRGLAGMAKEDKKSLYDSILEANFGFGRGEAYGVDASSEMEKVAMVIREVMPPELIVQTQPIDATITINMPPIQLDGRQVSRALTVQRTARLSEAARARGMLGGGVIQ